jgi:radical SAM protein with 4Fe4S-binding SPASM domain
MRALAGILHGSRAFGGPLQATLHITNRCNIRCVHCPFFSPYIERPILLELRRARLAGGSLPDDDYEAELQRHRQKADADSGHTHAILDELVGMGTRHFTFAGSGEPFLHPNIVEFIGRVKRARRACVVYTNGILLNRNTIDELIKMGADEIRVSLMAGSREMYERTHKGLGENTFETIRDNLLYLSQQKQATGSGRPIVTLINVVFSENSEGLLDFVEFAGTVRADRVSFQPFDHMGDQGLSRLLPTKTQAVSVRQQLTTLKTYLEARHIGHNIEFFQKVFRNKVNTMGLYNKISCTMGWLGVLFKPDGKVYPCCKCYTPMGNAYEEGFRGIWNGTAYRKFRKEALRINTRGRPVYACSCDSCPHYTLNLRVYRLLHPLKRHLYETVISEG